MPRPLDGVRVLDLSRLVAGGMLGMLLADFGADVVKVEQPGRGDPLRTWTTKDRPYWWRVYGRNKRSITLNLAHPRGRQLVQQLIPRFDVLVESFVPGKLESWGLGPDQILAWNPRMVIVRISGWGQTGPYRDRPGFGTLVEAASGFAAMTGEPDGPPLLPPFPMADMYAALYAASATMIALYHRDVHGGCGQVIDMALFEAVVSVLGPMAAEYTDFGVVRTRQGSRSRNAAPRGVYRTADGQYLAVSASTPDTAERFLQAYGLGHLLEDPRFATNEARVRHARELDQLVADAIASRTLAENRELIERHRLTAVPVQTIADILADPHWQARELFVDVGDEDGTVRMHRVIPLLSHTPGEIHRPGPPLGADNEAVYRGELGLSDEDLEDLRASGVI